MLIQSSCTLKAKLVLVPRGNFHSTTSTPVVCDIPMCRADIMEALPSKADPAVAGGPVSLPSQAAVLHGVRCARTQEHAADNFPLS